MPQRIVASLLHTIVFIVQSIIAIRSIDCLAIRLSSPITSPLSRNIDTGTNNRSSSVSSKCTQQLFLNMCPTTSKVTNTILNDVETPMENTDSAAVPLDESTLPSSTSFIANRAVSRGGAPHDNSDDTANMVTKDHDRFGNHRWFSVKAQGTSKRSRQYLTTSQKMFLRQLLAEGLGSGIIVFFGTGAVMSAILKDALGT
jgi:hypothetical protein